MSCEKKFLKWVRETAAALPPSGEGYSFMGAPVPHDRRDIVERLRSCTFGDRVLAYEAAAEIERLRSPVLAEDSEGVRYRCKHCGKNEREASATRCERSPCPMELISGADR